LLSLLLASVIKDQISYCNVVAMCLWWQAADRLQMKYSACHSVVCDNVGSKFDIETNMLMVID